MNIKFDASPLFPETTIFLGNGFDLDLGLHTKYTDFFNSKSWPVHTPEFIFDKLHMRLNGHCSDSLQYKTKKHTWFDLEDELKQYAIRINKAHATHPSSDNSEVIEADKKYYEELKNGLLNYLKKEVEDWGEKRVGNARHSAAYNLMHDLCKQIHVQPNVITFNYTDLNKLLNKCAGKSDCNYWIIPDKIQHIHGSLKEENIILGIDEDERVPLGYDFLFKSWDDHYCSHNVIGTLKDSRIILFFGLSFGNIDSVYFFDFFKSIINGSYDKNKKHIVIFTYNEDSMRDIKRQFFTMKISLMELMAHCDFHFILTNPKEENHIHKYDRNKFVSLMRDWNDTRLDSRLNSVD